MPAAPRKPCRHPGCCVLGTTSYCEAHLKAKQKEVVVRRKQYDAERGNRHQRGYNSRWVRASAVFKIANPICVHCEAKGITTLVYCVDHIVPHCGDMDLFWEVSNWQSLCKKCHDIKTAKEDGGFGNKKL